MEVYNRGLKNPPQSRTKLRIGFVILVSGFLSPLLIPLVVASNLSTAVKSILSGLLAFGIPEIFMLAAIAIMGKQGYEYIKGVAKKYLKRFAPPDKVGPVRYHIGLVLFCLPILMGFLQPYLAHFIALFEVFPFWSHITLDLMFVVSVFVLGGDFWDKLSGLFQYDSKIIRQS